MENQQQRSNSPQVLHPSVDMGRLLKQLEMLQLGGQFDGGSTGAASQTTATSNTTNGYQNQLMQIEIDDLDESPSVPYDADEAMADDASMQDQ